MLYGLIITENTEFIYWNNFDYQINDSILVSNNAKKYRSSDELLKICRPVFTIHYKKGIQCGNSFTSKVLHVF